MSMLTALGCVVAVWIMCREQDYVYRRGLAIGLTLALLVIAFAHP